MSGMKPFSACRSDCDSVLADDEMGRQDVEDGSNGGVSGAGAVLAEIVDGRDHARVPRLKVVLMRVLGSIAEVFGIGWGNHVDTRARQVIFSVFSQSLLCDRAQSLAGHG